MNKDIYIVQGKQQQNMKKTPKPIKN